MAANSRKRLNFCGGSILKSLKVACHVDNIKRSTGRHSRLQMLFAMNQQGLMRKSILSIAKDCALFNFALFVVFTEFRPNSCTIA